MTPLNRTLSILGLALALTACGPTAAPVLPTRTPPPTFTPTPQEVAPVVDPNALATAQAVETQEAAPQAPPAQQQAPAEGQTPGEQPATQAEQAAPTDTPTTEPTPTPQAAEVVATADINVRQGPGTNYNILGAARQGERFPVTGKNQAGDWWQINYNGQAAWVFGQLVSAQNTSAVQVAQNIPAAPPPPPPTNTPAPPPPAEQPPAEQPPAEQPPPADAGNYPFQLLSTERCDPNEGFTYFNGFVRYKDNSPRNGVCIHIAFYGPRNTKCSGCDGVGDGVWGFSPFGGPAKPGTTVEIFVVTCPGPMPMGGQTEQSGFGDLTPQSPKWVHTVQQSEQCTGITFVGD
jgi:uncharacterized protein YgiM (DUF1202 family)